MAESTDPGNDSAATSENTPENPTEAVPEIQKSDSEQLGDGGKKALDAERRRANAAEKERNSLRAKIEELENSKLSGEERANRERDLAYQERDQARAEALRMRIATKHQISDEDADLFLTGTDEETLTRQAQRLAERNKTESGLYVPGEGHQPSTAPALNSDDLEVALKRKLGIPA